MTVDEISVKLTGSAASLYAALEGTIAKLQKTSASAAELGKTLTAALTAPFAAIAGASIKTFASMETSLVKMQALAGQSREQVEAYGKEILNLAGTVGISADHLSDAMFYIVSGGAKGAKALAILTASAKASAAGMGDVKVVADAVKSAFLAYTKMGISAAQVADTLVAAVREGKLSAESLAPVMGRVLPLASAMGVAFSDVAGSMAAMSRVGASAAEASVAVTAFLSGLNKPSEAGQKYLESVG